MSKHRIATAEAVPYCPRTDLGRPQMLFPFNRLWSEAVVSEIRPHLSAVGNFSRAHPREERGRGYDLLAFA